MKRIALLIPLLLVIPLIQAADNATQASITPGESYFVNCTGNETYNITCLETHFRCYINKTLAPGELYQFDQGVCDITFNCSKQEEIGPEGVITFPSILAITRTNQTFGVNYTVWDYRGDVYKQRFWNITETDVIHTETDISFECPAEISVPINYETCQVYFEKWMRIDDPLLMQMATGQNLATQSLISCQADVVAKTELSKTWKANYDERHMEWEGCISDLNNQTSETNRLNIKMTGMVPTAWMWYLGVVSAVLMLLLAIAFDIIPLGWR